MPLRSHSIAVFCFASAALLAFSGCAGAVPPAPATTAVTTTISEIGSSPYTGALQGVAINGTAAAYLSSTGSLDTYSATWSRAWKNSNALSGLPPAITHIGDIDYYSGKLIAPVENYSSCSSFSSMSLALYDASNGALITWSDISADGHEVSSVAVVPEKNQVVISDFCPPNLGDKKLWIYDLTALLNNAPGTALSATGTITFSQSVPYIQGISWNAALGQFVVSADTSGTSGSLWYVSPAGVVSGPAYIMPPPAAELEGVDASTGSIYYLENGYVINLGPPVAAPTLSPAAGTYTGAQTLTLTDSTANAAIYYTVDGTMPTTASTAYSAPITVSKSQTIKAIAAVSGSVNSPMVVTTYTIN